jgi:virginiamycin B lyase
MRNRLRPLFGRPLRCWPALLLALALSGAAVCGPAFAQGGHGLRGEGGGTAISGAIEEFVLPEAISAPFSIAVDSAGKVWFAEKIGKALSVFDPETERFESHPLPSDWGNLGPSTIALGPRGRIWFSVRRWAEAEADLNILGEFAPDDGTFTKHVLDPPSASGEPLLDRPAVVPEDLLVDRRGTVWFLAPDENKVYRFDPAAGDLEGYPIPTDNSYPRGLSIDAEGTVWFVEANVNKIGKFAPDTAAFREYEIPTPFSAPANSFADVQGRIWFAEMSSNRLGVFYPDLERFDEVLIPTPRSLPNAIEADSSGNIWFLEYRGNKVGLFDPVEATFREYTIPTFGSEPGDLAIDHRRGRLWISEANTEARRLAMLSIASALGPVENAGAAGQTAPEEGLAAFLPAPTALIGSAILLVVVLTAVLLAAVRRRSWQ